MQGRLWGAACPVVGDLQGLSNVGHGRGIGLMISCREDKDRSGPINVFSLRRSVDVDVCF